MKSAKIEIIPLCVGCNQRHSPDTPCPDGTQWWYGLVECDICTYRHVAVIPVRPGFPWPPQDSQCPNCDAMGCNQVEDS